MAENKQIIALDEITVINAGSFFVIYDILTAKSYKIKVDNFVPTTDQNFKWISTVEYDEDEVSLHNDKWWRSLQDTNEGHIPSEDGIWWTQVSKSSSSSLAIHANGVYTDTNVFVMKIKDGSMQMYRLASATRPYNSTDFDTELEDGDWELVSEEKFVADINVVLSGGKTIGKYTNGQTIPAIGKTVKEVLLDIAIEYLLPAFSSFAITGQQATVEIGTTIASGSKTFTWGTINSGNVSANTIAVRDQTAGADLVTGLANDGTEAIVIASPILLAEEGDTQIYRIRGTNTNAGTFQLDFTITADYLRFYGVGSIPVDSAGVRALAGSTFGNTFAISIPPGETEIAFAYEATRPDISDSSVKYVEGFNSNVGNTFTKTTFDVDDADGTPRSYKVYTCTLGAPFPGTATYNVTIP